MEAWWAWLVCTGRAVGEYWKWLTGLGTVTGVSVAVKWARSVMIRKTARQIYKHMEDKNAATRERLGRAQDLIEAALGRTTIQQNAHRCNAACLNNGDVLGPICRRFIGSAFKRLRDEGLVVTRGGFHYITGTEPQGVN